MHRLRFRLRRKPTSLMEQAIAPRPRRIGSGGNLTNQFGMLMALLALTFVIGAWAATAATPKKGRTNTPAASYHDQAL